MFSGDALGGRPPSVKDVAALAGVSLGTVSNVLNKPDRVTEATRSRVEAAMAELGYVRNESARQLRAGSSLAIAYVMLDAGNPFFTDVARGAEEAAEAHHLSLFLCSSDSRADKELTYLGRLREQRVQGILITPVDPDSATLRALSRSGTPVVLVDRNSGGSLCSVAVDDRHGGRIAVEHLLERGHRRIAFVGGPESVGQVRDRRAGAQAAVDAALAGAEAHGGVHAELVEVRTDGLTVAQGRSAGQHLAGMPQDERPTAAFCANDLLALGLLQHCVASGTHVPQDLAIVGYDDIEFAAAAAVPLTSVRQPRAELGRRAAELLLEETGDPDHQHRQVEFTPELVARASTLGPEAAGGPQGQA